MKAIDNLIIFLFFFLISAPLFTLVGQTPELTGWHSIQPMPMSKAKCFEKAKNALRTAGLENVNTLDGWTASATNYNVRAGISCVECGGGVLVDIGVATTHGYARANEIRDYLKNYMSQDMGQQANLSGDWTYAGSRGTIRMEQSGSSVTMYLTVKPRTTPSPHYVIRGNVSGNRIDGTWEFTVNTLTGSDKKFQGSQCKGGRFYAQLAEDGKTISVLNTTEDPCNHGWAGTVFYWK